MNTCKNCFYFNSCGDADRTQECKGFQPAIGTPQKTYVVIGGLWFDKVNGNTYHNAKILETDGDMNIYYSGFAYGYGSAYLDEAKKYIKVVLGQDNAKVVNGGFFYLPKTTLKKNFF